MEEKLRILEDLNMLYIRQIALSLQCLSRLAVCSWHILLVWRSVRHGLLEKGGIVFNHPRPFLAFCASGQCTGVIRAQTERTACAKEPSKCLNSSQASFEKHHPGASMFETTSLPPSGPYPNLAQPDQSTILSLVDLI
ncbi:uncharacterized [Tachysurus ichikawai]